MTTARAGPTTSRMIFERRSWLAPCVRSTITTRATANAVRAWRDCATKMPVTQIQKQACAKRPGHRVQLGRAKAIAAAIPRMQPTAFLWMS